MIWIIIPARKNSKGFPGKNRKLFSYTADKIPNSLRKYTIVTTDDLDILKLAGDRRFVPYLRKSKLCEDDTNIRDVLSDVVSCIDKNDMIIMLYLTYPERTWKDIVSAFKYFRENKAKSLLCREELKEGEVHPYRWFYENKNKGTQILDHDLYRRQDYPRMFKASHYIFMAYVKEIKNLNKNLWNKNTVFFPIQNSIDIDHLKDFEQFKRSGL